MRALAHCTGSIAGQVARLGQLAALALQPLPGRLQITHAADRVLQPRARFARLRVVGFNRFLQLLQLAFDAVDARACSLYLALLALQLASQLGHRAVGLVQRTLRVFALLFSRLQLLAETGQLLFQLGLAVLQLLDLLAQLVDLAFAQ